MLTITCISDTHGSHRRMDDFIDIGQGDILIHAGDFSYAGRPGELADFNDWLGSLPFRYKIVIAGNHDREAYEAERTKVKRAFTNAIYLQDEAVELEGLKFYGSPWTPEFNNWYFMVPRGALTKVWQKIPADTDVLITHGPPFGRLDVAHDEHLGCEALAAIKVKPMLHCFGHIHEGHGEIWNPETVWCNCSSLTGDYSAFHAPFRHTIDIVAKRIV